MAVAELELVVEPGAVEQRGGAPPPNAYHNATGRLRVCTHTTRPRYRGLAEAYGDLSNDKRQQAVQPGSHHWQHKATTTQHIPIILYPERSKRPSGRFHLSSRI